VIERDPISRPRATRRPPSRSRPPPSGDPGRGPVAREDRAAAPRRAAAGDGAPRALRGPARPVLHLIKRDEIDIYDIPIAHITQQYLAYLDLMRSFDLEVAGEFSSWPRRSCASRPRCCCRSRRGRGGGGGRPARGAGAAADRVPPVQGGGRHAQEREDERRRHVRARHGAVSRRTPARARSRPPRCSTCSTR